MGLPGVAMDKNLPANTEDMGSIPGRKISHAMEQLSQCTTANEAELESTGCNQRAMGYNYCSLRFMRSHAPQREVPACCTQRKPTHSNKDPVQPKMITKNEFIKEKRLRAKKCSLNNKVSCQENKNEETKRNSRINGLIQRKIFLKVSFLLFNRANTYRI